MENAQALREVKQVEAEVRDLKENASRDAGEILREAEREATALIEQAKTDAEEAFQKGIDAARDEVVREREKVLEEGRKGADAIRGKKDAPAFKKAVDLILQNFENSVSGK